MEVFQDIFLPVFSCPKIRIVRAFSRGNDHATSREAQKEAISHPDSLKSRFKRIFSFEDEQVADIPIVCFGPEGLGR